jgi:hypothetical protein
LAISRKKPVRTPLFQASSKKHHNFFRPLPIQERHSGRNAQRFEHWAGRFIHPLFWSSIMSLSATLSSTARALRNGLIVAACCTSLGLAHAEGSDVGAEAQAQAQVVVAIKSDAVYGQAADLATTGVGLLLGAAEANPLGILTLGVKAMAYKQIKESPTVEQPRMWSMYGALGWGAAANNLCVIAAIATGGGAAILCPLIGLGAGVGSWNADAKKRDEATFAAICQEEKVKNRELVCIYNGANT